MAAVIAAIVAAFLAGAIALYRERRIELRRLLVAARIVGATLGEASIYMDIFASDDYGWNVVDKLTAMLDFSAVWAEHREVLAAHLSQDQWDSIATAASGYLLVVLPDESRTSTADSRDRFVMAGCDMRDAEEILRPFGDSAGFLRNPGFRTRVTAEADKGSGSEPPNGPEPPQEPA